MRRIAAVASAGAIAAGLVACTRQADLIDEPDALQGVHTPMLEAGDIPPVDSGIRSDAFPSCTDRSGGLCQGPVDFPCNFDQWVPTIAARCQQSTGCRTNGWLRVKLGSDGCIDEIGMDAPNDAILACLVAEMGTVRCPCSNGEFKYFFGLGNGIGSSADGGGCSGPHG